MCVCVPLCAHFGNVCDVMPCVVFLLGLTRAASATRDVPQYFWENFLTAAGNFLVKLKLSRAVAHPARPLPFEIGMCCNTIRIYTL